MKKLICVGWCDADDVINYGQILQGCSMLSILHDEFNGEIIFASYMPRKLINKLFYIKGHVNICNGHLQAYLKTRFFIKKFLDANIKLKKISSFRNLKKLCKDADVLICGSDQIWHPVNFNPGYFLDVDNKQARKIAFAASLPKKNKENQFADVYVNIGKLLKQYDHIAVREPSSINLLSNIIEGKKIKQVIDPTLLIPRCQWKELEDKDVINEDYIFVYIPNGMSEEMGTLIDNISKMLRIKKVKMLVTRGELYNRKYELLKFVSVAKFLTLIDHAKVVYTSSFHAAVFSIIFHKEFWCYDVPNVNRGEDYRLQDLLNQFGLSERMVSEGISDFSYGQIDYSNVDIILKRKQEEAFDYLRRAIS